MFTGRVCAGALLLAVAALAFAPDARAGRFHVYSCRTPAGGAAPVDGWGGSTRGSDAFAFNTCGKPGGALVAAMGEAERTAETESATWAFTPSSSEKLLAADLWRAGDAEGGAEVNAGYLFAFAGPTPTSIFDSCAYLAECVSKGNPAEPLAAANRVTVSAPHSGGQLFMTSTCGGIENYPCPANKGDPNGYAAVVYLYAADITIEQTATPTAGNAGGEVATAQQLTGRSDLTFDAADPGAGVYEAVFSVDGQVVQRTVLDENGGRCRNVGQTSDGTLAFLYLQPCPGSLGADIAFDTTSVPNGLHHLVVSVLDAAGNAAPVLDRYVTFYNPPPPPPPGPPNGLNASAQAKLFVRWSTTKRTTLTVRYGRRPTVVGRLLAPGGVPIVGAKIDAEPAPAIHGGRLPDASARTDGHGRFTLRLPAGLPSSSVRVGYRLHLGDADPAVSRTLHLDVRAGLSLRIVPVTVSAGGTIFFRGRLLGRPVPAAGKQLVLEARSPGGTWIEFKVVRSDFRGRYRASYRFKFPGPALYQFRVLSEPESDYPYAAGSSRAVSVRER